MKTITEMFAEMNAQGQPCAYHDNDGDQWLVTGIGQNRGVEVTHHDTEGANFRINRVARAMSREAILTAAGWLDPNGGKEGAP